MFVTNCGGPAIKIDTNTEYDFECMIISYGKETYVSCDATSLLTNKSGKLENIFDNIDLGIEYIHKFLSKFKEFNLKILEFDKEYDQPEEARILEKWKNE